ncbi:hypothetical protein ACLKA7_005456, partial [Drosophila subpalustris]
MDPEEIIEISDEEKPWLEVQVEVGSTSGTEPERVGSDDSRPHQEPWSGPSYRKPRRESFFYGQQRREGGSQPRPEGSERGSWESLIPHRGGTVGCSRPRVRRKRQHSRERARRAKESGGLRKRRKGISAEKEAPPGLACRISVDEDPSRPEEAAVARQGEPTPRPPVDQGEPKAPSPTDSELMWDMEDMLEGWDPELDAMFGEMADPSATLDPLIPKG